MKFFLNGRNHPDANSLPYSASLLQGDGLFETILGLDEKLIAWEQHYQRLCDGGKRLLIKLPEKNEIEAALAQILIGCTGKSRVRLSVLSDGNWIITMQAVVDSNEPVTLMKMKQISASNNLLTGIKSISYGQSILAQRLAVANGYTDAIFLNENAHVVEASMANILILTDQGFLTPKLDSGCLPGVMRQLLIKWFEVKEENFTFEQLVQAKGVCITSSIKLVRAVTKVEDRLFAPNASIDDLISKFETKLFSRVLL